MQSREIRKKFLDFFEKRGHKVVPSSSLVPDDPSVLLTTAGMQQFKPYFLGEADPMKDFGARRATSVQKSFRTSDIDEVGDERHLTFFEMLGHFSFGDYFKKETIKWTYELLTDIFGIKKDRISATVFAGDDKIPFDEESYNTWVKFLPESKIKKGPRADNVWGPPGPEGPCGAANEVYVDGMEVATLVFMEYFCAKDGGLTPLSQKGVDVGWGLERMAMIIDGKANVFETDLLQPIIDLLPKDLNSRKKRIIADHSRAIAFLISDGVRPSNKEAGYILRRLMRRLITHLVDINSKELFSRVINLYNETYPSLNLEAILSVFSKEKEKFDKTLKAGIKELKGADRIDPKLAFKLYESFGLPYEVIKDVASEKARALKREDFDKEFEKHQKISRAGREKKFGGHGLILDTGELKAANEEELRKVTRLHTATHLLQAALRKVLGNEVEQRGSDITAERARFDFAFPRKVTGEELKKAEALVNEAVKKALPMQKKTMPFEEAKKTGALYFFKGKYPAKVNVYYAGETLDSAFSKELCGGPHVQNTKEVGEFKILKEESASAGIRRIRANVL
ncbi:MAG: glycine--tRNA ligase subunit alpha [Candidatus Colwellbacteria bacterium]|nr:glycine--tRNA ligase subunit alpha [Candidatus Colwellbacteria bacterium]